MSKKKTHDEFLKELKEKQPQIFNSIKIITEYKGAKDHIFVKDKYGLCKTIPSNLLYGKSTSILSAVDKNEYLRNIIRIEHPNIYDKIEYFGNYNGSKEDMIIKTKYGYLKTKPLNLIRGKFPKTLSAVNKDEYFIARAIEIHGNKYGYDKIDYKRRLDKVCIICPVHGEFWQTPMNHINGFGCEECGYENGVGKYNKKNAERNREYWESISANVYVFKFFNKNEEFYKIGITTHENPINRFKNGYGNYKFELLDTIKTNLYTAVYIELALHEYFSSYKYKPKLGFSGWTECFSSIDLDYIKSRYVR